MEPPINDYTDLLRNNADMSVSFRKGMIERGVFMIPINLKRNAVTFSHTQEDIDQALQTAKEVLSELIKG